MMEIMYMTRWLAEYKSSLTYNHLLDINIFSLNFEKETRQCFV
jgi:hypothetical protein